MAGLPKKLRAISLAGVCLLAGPKIAGAEDAPTSEFWRGLREGSRTVVDELKERARPRWEPLSQNAAGGAAGPEAEGESQLGHLERWSPPGVVAPTFSRIAIEPEGATEITGRGTPGSRVVLKAGGIIVGRAKVAESGQWQAMLDRPLAPGVHRIESAAGVEGQVEAVVGSDVRISIPAGRSGELVVRYNGEGARDPVRDRAEALARDAGEAYSQIMPRQTAGQARSDKGSAPLSDEAAPPSEGANPVVRWLERSAKEYQETVIKELSAPGPGTGSERAQLRQETPRPAEPDQPGLSFTEEALRLGERANDWLAKSKRGYQEEVVRRLSVPRDSAAPLQDQETARSDEPAALDGTAPADVSAERRDSEDAERLRREAGAEEARRIAETRRLAEEAAQREADAKRQAEEALLRAEEEKRLAEAQRLKDAEAQRQAEREKAEADRKAAELRRAEEEAERAAEQERASEEAERKAAEARQKAEAERLAAEAKRKTEDERRAAEAARRTEERRLAEEAKAKDAAARKAAAERVEEEARRREEEEAASRLAADVERRRAGSTEPEAAPAQRSGASEAKVPEEARRKMKDSRPSEGSAEGDETEPGYSAPSDAKPRICRGPRLIKVKGRRMYMVQPGDTLWSISRRFYGSGARYHAIYRANRARIADPNFIADCRRIYIPRLRKRSDAGEFLDIEDPFEAAAVNHGRL